jgi:SAM-dependent methyltransferase
MKPTEIAAIYDALADHWASDRFPADNGIEQHKKAIAFSTGSGVALNIGCGSSGRIEKLLLKAGFSVHAIDISERMLALARPRCEQATYEYADITTWCFPHRYDFITAWDSIWHLGIEGQKPVLRKIAEGLKEGGIFIFTTGAVDQPTEHTDTCMGQKLFYGVLGIPGLLALLQDCGLILRHFEYDQYPEKHLYLVVQKALPSPN